MTIQEKHPLHTFELEVTATRTLREIKTHCGKPVLKAEILKLHSMNL